MFDITAATYDAYIERKKREGKKPLTRAEWTARTQGGTAGGAHPKGNKPIKTWSKKYSPKVEEVMDNHAMTDDDADQVREFKSDKPGHGVKQTPQQLMQKFLANAKPETKERMKGMSPAEFMQILGAIMDDEGAGKTASLRSRLIRLAAAKPELRADLLPLLKEDADPVSHDQNRPESYYGLPPRGVQASGSRTARLMSRQETILQKYMEAASASGVRAATGWDELPNSVRAALRRVKDQETLWMDVDRWFMDNAPASRWASRRA
jgi:hypothetical protein